VKHWLQNHPAGSPAEPATSHNSGSLALQFNWRQWFHVPALFSVRHSGESRNPGDFQPCLLDSGFRRNDELNFMANQVIRQNNKENP
jgi:hypothetical protein